MKLAVIAIAAAALAGPAFAADLDAARSAYIAGAFDNADADWRRLVANRHQECGSYGKDRRRRVDLLVDRYNALGAALNGGDEAAVSEAAQSLAAAIGANARFGDCWEKLAKRGGISGDFTRAIAA